MINTLLKVKNNKLVKNIAIVATGTAVAQLITIALLPIITRLYGPEAYGHMGIFIAIVMTLSPVVALTLPIAIVLPKSNRESISVVRTSIILTFLVSSLSGVVIFFFKDKLTLFFKAESISDFLYLIPVAIFFTGIYDILKQITIRKKLFKVLSRVTVLQPIILYGSMVIIGIFHQSATILIILTAFRSVISSCVSLFELKKNEINLIKETKRWSLSHREVLWKFKDFPFYRAPEVFISALTSNFPVILLAAYIGPASAGFYTLARTGLSIPTHLIGKSVSDVFYPRIVQGINNNEIVTRILIKSTFSLILIGILPFGFVSVYGPWLFELVFGEEWRVAGEFARWISIMSFFLLVNRPAISAVAPLKLQRFHLIFTLTLSLLQITSLYIGLSYYSSAIIGVALFSGVSGLMYLVEIILIIWNSRLKK